MADPAHKRWSTSIAIRRTLHQSKIPMHAQEWLAIWKTDRFPCSQEFRKELPDSTSGSIPVVQISWKLARHHLQKLDLCSLCDTWLEYALFSQETYTRILRATFSVITNNQNNPNVSLQMNVQTVVYSSNVVLENRKMNTAMQISLHESQGQSWATKDKKNNIWFQSY